MVFSPHFTIQRLFSVASPFSALEFIRVLQKTRQKINNISKGSEKPPHTLFFRFKENAFFWRQTHFYPLLELLPPKIHASSEVTFFSTFEPPNNNPPKKVYVILTGPEKPPHAVFSILHKSLLLVAVLFFSQ